MHHRCKKCGKIKKKCHYSFYMYGVLGKKAFCRILKRWLIDWITGLNVQTFFLLFWHHNYQVTLKIPDMHEAKFVNKQHTKSLGAFFWQLFHRWGKWSQSWKVLPGGRSEIKNVMWCMIYSFNFRFSNLFKCQDAFYIYGPLVKKHPSEF